MYNKYNVNVDKSRINNQTPHAHQLYQSIVSHNMIPHVVGNVRGDDNGLDVNLNAEPTGMVGGDTGHCCDMACCCASNLQCQNFGKSCSCTVNRLAPVVIPFFTIFVMLVFSFAIPTSINHFTADGKVVGSSTHSDTVGNRYCGACNPKVQNPMQCNEHFVAKITGYYDLKTCVFPMAKCKLNGAAVGSIFTFCILGFFFIVVSLIGARLCCCVVRRRLPVGKKYFEKQFKYQWAATLLLYLTFAFNILALHTFMNNIGEKVVERYPTLKYEKRFGSVISGKWVWNNSLTEFLPYQYPLKVPTYKSLGGKVESVVKEMYEYQIYDDMPCQSIHDYDILRATCINMAAIYKQNRDIQNKNLYSHCNLLQVHGFWVTTYVFLWLTFTILLVYSVLSCFYICCKKREDFGHRAQHQQQQQPPFATAVPASTVEFPNVGAMGSMQGQQYMVLTQGQPMPIVHVANHNQPQIANFNNQLQACDNTNFAPDRDEEDEQHLKV